MISKLQGWYYQKIKYNWYINRLKFFSKVYIRKIIYFSLSKFIENKKLKDIFYISLFKSFYNFDDLFINSFIREFKKNNKEIKKLYKKDSKTFIIYSYFFFSKVYHNKRIYQRMYERTESWKKIFEEYLMFKKKTVKEKLRSMEDFYLKDLIDSSFCRKNKIPFSYENDDYKKRKKYKIVRKLLLKNKDLLYYYSLSWQNIWSSNLIQFLYDLYLIYKRYSFNTNWLEYFFLQLLDYNYTSYQKTKKRLTTLSFFYKSFEYIQKNLKNFNYINKNNFRNNLETNISYSFSFQEKQVILPKLEYLSKKLSIDFQNFESRRFNYQDYLWINIDFKLNITSFREKLRKTSLQSFITLNNLYHTRQINRKLLKNDIKLNKEYILNKKIYSFSSVQVSQLISKNELILEWRELHHCVWGYWTRVYKWKYIIFSLKLKSNSKIRSTLEIQNKKEQFSIVQHMSYFNEKPNKKLLLAWENILKNLNKEKWKLYS